MTPQEAAELTADEFLKTKTPIERWDDPVPRTARFIVKIMDDYVAYKSKWQSERDNQALSSALKEIAELHAKVKELQQDVEHNAKRAIGIARERDELEEENNLLEQDRIKFKDALNDIISEIDNSSMITWMNKAYTKAKSVLK